jgi:predicted RNase H-like nuclease (RuvC/YqgF family)
MVDSLQLMRQIAVKAIVTENFKIQAGNEIARNLEQLDAELQQLEFRTKRTIAEFEKGSGTTPSPEAKMQIETLRLQLEAEKTRINQIKEELQGQRKILAELPLGSVVTQFTVENPIEVKVGENIFQRLEGGEILVKDGIIQEIKL